VRVRDADDLSRAICMLLRDKEKCYKINIINRNLVLEKAEHVKQMKKIECIYQDALKYP